MCVWGVDKETFLLKLVLHNNYPGDLCSAVVICLNASAVETLERKKKLLAC